MTAFTEALKTAQEKHHYAPPVEQPIPGTPRKMTTEERLKEKAEYDEQQKALGLYCDNPRPYIGQIVRWFPNGIDNEDSVGAVVVRVGINAVHLRIFEDGMPIPYKDSVLHLRNPEVRMRRENRRDHQFNGCWDFTPESYVIDQLKIDMGALLSIIGELRSRVNTLEELLTKPATVSKS